MSLQSTFVVFTEVLGLQHAGLFPDPRLLLYGSQTIHGYKDKTGYGCMSALMKWRHLGHMQLLSRAKPTLTAMAPEEACPRDEIR